MAIKKFLSTDDYVKNLCDDSGLATVPVGFAADFLGVTRAMINDYLKNGKIDFVRVPGSSSIWRGVIIESLVRFQKEQATNASKIVIKTRKELERCAKKGVVIEYGVLMEKVGLSSQNPNHRGQIGKILGAISEATLDENGFMLSALAVLKSTRMPNEPFFDLAIFQKKFKETQDKDKFFNKQIKLIFNHYQVDE